MSEDVEKNRLPILIKPDDIAELGKSSSEFLQLIREWKNALSNIIASKVLASVGLQGGKVGLLNKLTNYGGQLVKCLAETIDFEKQNINLLPMQRKLIDGFLSNHKIIVYIDDLDRGWVGKKEDISRISALLNACRDLIGDNKGLQIRISLRADVYYLVRTSDESTDKIEGSVVWFN